MEKINAFIRQYWPNTPRVVIVGGGFAGLYAAQSLRRAPVGITLIDRRNFHLFQPLLYQVATGALSPANIASPLRGILSRQHNVRVLQGEVTDVDVARREVILGDDRIGYDFLILATGCRHHYFGHDDWEELAPGLKSIEDALAMRGRILSAFERAEREPDAERRRPWMTFVVVGGGPTGVELAGALGELAHHTLRRDFRSLDPRGAVILLVEGTDRLLPTYPPSLSEKAAASLRRLGVCVRTETFVEEIREGAIVVRTGDRRKTIAAQTVLWAAGVQASPLGRILARATGAELDRQGRVLVEADLSLPSHSEIFVLGDLAHYSHQGGKPLPGVAPVAIQQGKYVAKLLRHRLQGQGMPSFRYKNRGSMAVIGRAAAVADLGRLRFHGFLAWLLWLFIHVIQLVEFENRLLVLVQWGWNYFTRNRSARLITETVESRESRVEGRKF